MTNSNMTCEAFDAALPDHLEGTLGESRRAAVQKHLSECVRCASMVKDLEKIQRDAAALPDLVPSRDLWQGIEARIAAPVIPLTARPERQRRFARAWMGVAAAALIISTAGITYMLTARSFQGERQVAVMPSQGTPEPAQPVADTEPTAESPPPAPANVGAVATRKPPTVARLLPGASRPTQSGLEARLASQEREQSELVYGKEIDKLQKIVTERRNELDSTTVAIIEKNLQIIDAAIARSRAALKSDPASRLLGDQLTHALDMKVELLRTAALLPRSA